MELKRFFNPNSIAIVGVSQKPGKVGHLVAQNMMKQGFKGNLYFVHPSGETILGKQTYKDLKAIGRPVDLVIFAIPADAIIANLDQVHEIGCQNVLIYAAGFKENHTTIGDTREKELLEKVKTYNLNVLGPNCIGFCNTHDGINATFLKDVVAKGNIGIISQSGALGSALVDHFAAQTNLGISYFFSLGNKSIMNESDVLEFLAADRDTKVIGMYLEDVADGPRFRKVLETVSKVKPVVILKAGRTEEGSKAAVSHTGSMVGNDEVFENAVLQSGAIRTYTFSHFQIILKLYSFEQVPVLRRILVLSNAGGMGVMLADELLEQNLSLVTISEKTKKKLYRAFDDFKKITVHNPIDLLGDASAFDYEKAVKLTMQEQDIGAVVVLLTPQANTQIIETAQILVAEHKKKLQIPLYPVFMGGSSVIESHTFFEKQKVASFRYFSELPHVLNKILSRSEYLHEQKTKQLQSAINIDLTLHNLDIKTKLVESNGKKFLNQYDSLKIIEYSGIKTANTYLATSGKDLKSIIEIEGYPLVAKVASEKITHKTEVKGVITGLNTWDELTDAYEYMIRIGGAKSGCYIQKQFSGHEFILGAKRDTTFGIVVLIGLGGVYAELLKEVVNCVYPFSLPYFERTIMETKMKKLFEGYRKTPPVNIEHLFQTATNIGMLMDSFPAIQEIDINPLIVSGDEMIAVDARIII